MDDKFVDLAITPKEREEEKISPMEEARDEPIYPFGTSMSLENDQIEKLGLEDGEVGDYLHIAALVKLCGLHVTETESGQRKCMQLQVTHIKILGNEDDESEEAFERPTSRDLYDRK
jgi:hypothetical protein